MAGKGTYAAYAPLRGIQDNTSRNLRYAEQVGFQKRREERQKEDARRQRLEKLAKDMGTDMSQLTFKESGVKSVDAPLYEYFSRTKGEVADLYNRIVENPEDYDARILLEKKMNSAKTLAGFTGRYADYMKNYKEAKAAGQTSDYLNKNIPEKISKGLLNGNYKVLNDKNGELQLFVDVDGDGELDKDFAAINVHEFIAGNPLYDIKLKTTVDEVVTGLSDNYGAADITTEDGFTKTQVKGFDPKNEDALMQDINQLVGSYENMTDEAKSMLADDLGIDPATIDKKGFQEFKRNIANAVKAKFDRVQKTDTDFGAQISAGNLAERRKENAGFYDKEDQLNPTDEIQLMTGEGANQTEDGEYDNASLFSLPSSVTVDVSGGTFTANQIILRNGEVSFKGYTESGSGDNKAVAEKEITSDNKKNVIVRNITNPETGIKFKNLAEFTQYLRTKKETQGLPDL